MKNNLIMTIAGAVILFLLGLAIGMATGGPSVNEIQAAVGKRIDDATAAQSERIAALETGLGELKDGLAGGFDAGAQAVAGIGSEIKGLSESLASTVQTTASDQLAALESGLAGLRGQIAAPAPEASAAAPAAVAAAAPVDPSTPPTGNTAGETAMLADGALRAFVSRVDDAGQTAAVRVNGSDMVLTVGQSQTISSEGGDCKLTLDAVDRGHATMSGACGDALPPPDGAAAGETVMLAEGLRAFVSRVSDDGASIAVNGVATQTVGVGEAIEAKAGDQICKVTVTSVDRGRVALGYTCG